MKTLFLLLLVLPLTIKAQDFNTYYQQLYQAELLAKNGSYDSALVVYVDAFKDVDYILSRILLDQVIPVAKLAKNKAALKKYKKLYNSQKKCPKENEYILHLVDSIAELDQKVRGSMYIEAQQYVLKYKNDIVINKSEKYLESKKLYDYWAFVDSSNIAYMLQLIDTYGFIGEQMIGFYNFNIKSSIILLHFDKDTNNIVLEPILKKALLTNKISPSDYALIIDRHLYSVSKTQKYWTWFMISEDPKLSDLEIKKTIKLREEIGLWGTTFRFSHYKDSWMLNIYPEKRF